MTHDIIKLNNIVKDIERSISELSQIDPDGSNMSPTITPDQLTEMVGLPISSWPAANRDLIWFYALKTLICARQILEETDRIFQQVGDEATAQKAQTLTEAFDIQFHPAQTAFQVYSRLLDRSASKVP